MLLGEVHAEYGIDFRRWYVQPDTCLSCAHLSSCLHVLLDAKNRLADPAAAPPAAHLHASAVSYPLVFVTQMAHYVGSLARLGLSQQEMRTLLDGSTGHSQGVVAAAVASLAADDEALVTHTGASSMCTSAVCVCVRVSLFVLSFTTTHCACCDGIWYCKMCACCDGVCVL